MLSQKARKRLGRQAERSQKCVCGNFCGADGLCNACRAAKEQGGQCRPFKTPSCGQPRTRAEAAKIAVLVAYPPGMEEEVRDYFADMASTLFEELEVDLNGARHELETLFVPLLQEYDVSAADAAMLCQCVLDAVFSASDATIPQGKSDGAVAFELASVSEHDVICRVPNLLLMYGGSPEPLLRNTVLEVVRGHRYGVVGTNGSGKTTLMTKIAGKGIVGMPQVLKVEHLRHDKILDGVAPFITAQEYAQRRIGHGGSDNAAVQALIDVGFDSELLGKAVVTLSGGWQMRLELACAMAQNADLLLLDEPTNHLDAAGQEWLVNFITKTRIPGRVGATAMIVSHDPEFLDQVCTDVIHFTPEGKLAYHPGNFSAFKANALDGDSAKATELLETTSSRHLGLTDTIDACLKFPSPGKTCTAPVISLHNAFHQYPNMNGPVLRNVNVRLLQSSRVGIVGKNGSGKSTLLALLAGRLKPTLPGESCPGEVYWYKGLRVAYVAQHSMVHLGEFQSLTPLEYLQLRFRRGFDMETPNSELPAIPKEEAERLRTLGIRHGKRGMQVEALLSRIEWGEGNERESLYETKWVGLGPAENTFETLARLKQLGVDKMVSALDEKLFYAWGDAEPRPLTTREIVTHLTTFGLSEDVTCNRKISMLSSGQKCRLAFAGAFWTRPHVLCLDEPTNYLDAGTVELLSHAIRSFRGCCVVVSHCKRFVEDVCTEVWELNDGSLTIHKTNANANTALGGRVGGTCKKRNSRASRGA